MREISLESPQTGDISFTLGVFGGFSLTAKDGRPLRVRNKKNQALLAAIALSPAMSLARTRLAGLLWSDCTDRQGLTNLRQSLRILRRELGADQPFLLDVDGAAISLSRGNVRVDAIQFRALARLGTLASLREAADLYRDELLANTSISDPVFEDWLRQARLAFNNEAIELLQRLATLETGEASVAAARRAVALDPINEKSHRILMRCLVDAGSSALAIKHYRNLETLLQHELNTSPSLATTTLRARLGSKRPPHRGTSAVHVLVLPCTSAVSDPAAEHVREPMSEELVRRLKRYQTLTVAESHSLNAARGVSSGAAIAEITGASHSVESRLRRSTNGLMLSVRLIDLLTGQDIWNRHFDVPVTRPLQVTSDIAAWIAIATEHHMVTDRAIAARYKERQALRPEDYVIQAREAFARYEAYTSVPLLQEALSLDPDFGPAHAYMAQSFIELYWQCYDGRMLDRAHHHAQRALDISEDAASEHAMAYSLLTLSRLGEAGDHFERAASLGPAYSAAAIDWASWFTKIGQPEESCRRLERLVEFDSLLPNCTWEIWGNALFQMGRYDEAICAYSRLDVDHFWFHAVRGSSYALGGEPDLARGEIAMLRKKRPDVDFRMLADLSGLHDETSLERYRDGLQKAALPV